MTGLPTVPIWATIVVAGLGASCGCGAGAKDQGAALARSEQGRLSDDSVKRENSNVMALEPPMEIPEECPSSDQGECSTNSWIRDWTPSDRRIARSGIRGRGCRGTPECKERGRCAGHAPGECYEATSDSCQRSFYCEYEGLCKDSEGVCVVAERADCNRSTVCTHSGQCDLGSGHCVATSSENCRKSLNCGEYGLCSLGHEICVAADSNDCTKSGIGQRFGRCHALQGGCFAFGDADCNRPCKLFGRCGWERGTCVVRSDADCKESKACKRAGRCQLFEGECEASWTVERVMTGRKYGLERWD